MLVIFIEFNLLYLCDFLKVVCKVIDFLKKKKAKQEADKAEELKEKAKKAVEGAAEHEVMFYNRDNFIEGIQLGLEQDKESVFSNKQNFINKI